MADRCECVLDDVRCAQMLSVLRWEVVEPEQGVAILDEGFKPNIVLDTLGLDEGIEGPGYILLGLGHPDLLRRPLGFRVLALRQLVKDISILHRSRGRRTATGPMPVMISRSGRWP